MVVTVLGRSPSWNKIYQAKHWMFRKTIVDSIHSAVTLTLLEQKIPRKLFRTRVDIIVTAYFNKHAIDSDNVPAKIFIDALKAYLLKDDATAFVRRVTTESVLDKDNPERVTIEILAI